MRWNRGLYDAIELLVYSTKGLLLSTNHSDPALGILFLLGEQVGSGLDASELH